VLLRPRICFFRQTEIAVKVALVSRPQGCLDSRLSLPDGYDREGEAALPARPLSAFERWHWFWPHNVEPVQSLPPVLDYNPFLCDVRKAHVKQLQGCLLAVKGVTRLNHLTQGHVQ